MSRRALRPKYIILDMWEEPMCLCGNTATDLGFIPCTAAGAMVDPATEVWDPQRYLCAGCWRIIDDLNGEVMGYAVPLW